MTTLQDPPWWVQPCADAIAKLGGTMCDTPVCEEIPELERYAHAVCLCQPPYLNGCSGPNPPPGCCQYGEGTPIAVLDQDCYCCCGSVARTMPVAYDATSYRPVDEFAAGDMVYVADDTSLGSWSRQPVVWSAGSAAGGGIMLNVVFEADGRAEYLVVNRSQLFLTSERKLKPAAALVPGADSLVGADGEPRRLLSLEAGQFDQPLHHLATSAGAARSPARHLLLAKGVVCGDWALQIGLHGSDTDRLELVEGHAELPQLGTPEYREANPGVEHTEFGASLPDAAKANGEGAFTSLGDLPAVPIPAGAHSFVTQGQAEEIQGAVHQLPATSSVVSAVLPALFRQFRGAYPHIAFRYDVATSLPNAYVFQEHGQDTVVVTSGLVRTDGVGREALAMVIAHSVGAFYGGPPLDAENYSCTGQADYAAVAAVIPYVWPGLQGAPVVKAGLAQLTALFAAVTDGGAGPDQCTQPSLDCRIAAMQAALRMEPLPECAVGPPEPRLEVTGASAVASDPTGEPTVTVSFNLELDPDSAQAIANYSFEPPVKVHSISLGQDMQVDIWADVEADAYYELTVLRVLSADKNPLVRGKNKASFVVAEAPPPPPSPSG
jgi:hypothetical protein